MTTRKDRRPRIACEFNAAAVVAARAGENGIIDLSAVRMLPPGAMSPNLTGANIVNRAAVRTAVQEAMAVLDTRARDVIAVLPDAACRLVLLDFDTLPEKREDVEAVVRFRLKKSLPFDVERARVSWQAQEAGDKLNLLAAVTLTIVLEEYESVLREAGFNPGFVVPSMLAALGQVDASVPTLVIKVDPLTTGLAIVNRDGVLLTRTLDHPADGSPEGLQLAEDIYPSLVYFQDTYGTQVERILVSGLGAPDELNSALSQTAGLRAQELVSTSRLGVAAGAQRAALGAVAGVLA
jgi:type IV pilus assembly protein PilM